MATLPVFYDHDYMMCTILTRRRRFYARRVIGGGRTISCIRVFVMETPGGSAPLQVFIRGAEDPKRVSSVEGTRGGEGRTASFVGTPVEDLVVGIAWNERGFD